MKMKMKMMMMVCFFIVTSAPMASCSISNVTEHQRETYIVYMGSLPAVKNYNNDAHQLAADRHHIMLSYALGGEELARRARISSFGRSFDGFSARLLPQEAEKLREYPNVVSVFLNQIRKFHTVRSWDLLGMSESIQRNHRFESDIIIGVLDSGIFIDAPSFEDKGMGPPPAKWKGICQKGTNFTRCNNKVIGARAYNYSGHHPDPSSNYSPSPIDMEGHGSHTASIAAGSVVKEANLYGLLKGTARGGVPSARLAVYNVCPQPAGCSDLNIMHAFDDAIADGVDIISVSLGRSGVHDYFDDSISIGAFHAMTFGVFTSASAGNSGPFFASVENTAPWVTTVGASGTDRQLATPVAIGNGFRTLGLSMNTFSTRKRFVPLINGGAAQNLSVSSNAGGGNPGACEGGRIMKDKVQGKVVLCYGSQYIFIDDILKQYGALGVLVGINFTIDTTINFLIPAAVINAQSYLNIQTYINSTKNPRVLIYKSRDNIHVDSPFIASFSSRGPDVYSKSILKPDLVAPGVNILAAFSRYAPITRNPKEYRYGEVFNILSGTSMACPHVSAAAAYVKSFHPHWSPAAIKSSLMTTASLMEVNVRQSGYAYGSGQIDPVKAVDPGLVYDIGEEDYIGYLCNMGYNRTTLRQVVGRHVICRPPPKVDRSSSDVLNYPSMNIQIPLHRVNQSFSAVFVRTVTNVGDRKAIYTATAMPNKLGAGLRVEVSPDTLVFGEVNERKSFKVFVHGSPVSRRDTVLSGSLVWKDGSGHRVRSPIVVSAMT